MILNQDFFNQSFYFKWLSLKVGTAKSSVAEYYIQRNYPALAQHMRRYAFQDVEEGIQRLR